jgi:hypothetical protein
MSVCLYAKPILTTYRYSYNLANPAASVAALQKVRGIQLSTMKWPAIEAEVKIERGLSTHSLEWREFNGNKS